MNKQRDPKKEKQWLKHLETFKAEKLSINQFCSKYQLKRHQFYYWRDRLKKKIDATPKTSPGFIEVTPEKQTSSQNVGSYTAVRVKTIKVVIPIQGYSDGPHIEIHVVTNHD